MRRLCLKQHGVHAKEAGIDYVRFERPEISLPYYDKLYHAKDEFEAAGMAGKLGKSVLLTTGSKTLSAFVHSEALKERKYGQGCFLYQELLNCVRIWG